jgi:DNA-binding GntR family transcriptional regulator
MSTSNYILDLNRNLPQTMHEQACEAIMAAIRSERPGFCIGDRLTTQELSRQNAIHRNTLTYAMSDLVRLGYLRRLPNKGFEVVHQDPERPSLLTRHFLSLTEVAQRDKIESRSQLVPDETGLRKVSSLSDDLARITRDMNLTMDDSVSVLTRSRLMKKYSATHWDMVAIEQTFISTALAPDLLDNILQQIREEGDSSFYRQLHRIFLNEEFFKAHYEISLSPLPKTLAVSWTGSINTLISVISITYCSQGPVEMTRTWFDATKAVLTAGSLDVKIIGSSETE